mmetsp:Transcript_5595/g.11161  ORF Transcript_5595/g.11161 Transcript_5595/m.11161 type:complete len:421 (+) Transcript_5595:192-1454(+)
MGGRSTAVETEEEMNLSEHKKKDKKKSKTKEKEKKSEKEKRSSSKSSSSHSRNSTSSSSGSTSKRKKSKSSSSKSGNYSSDDDETDAVAKKQQPSQPSLSEDDYGVAMRVLAFLQHHKFVSSVKAFEKEIKTRNGSIDRTAVGAAIHALENPEEEESESESEQGEPEIAPAILATTDSPPLVEETGLANVIDTVDDLILNSPNAKKETLSMTVTEISSSDGGLFGTIIEQDRPQTNIWDNKDSITKQEAINNDSGEDDEEVELMEDDSSSSSSSSSAAEEEKDDLPKNGAPRPQTPPPAPPTDRKTTVSFNSVVARDEFEAFSPKKKRDLFYSKDEIDTFKKLEIREKKAQLKAKALEEKEAREAEIRKAHAKQLAEQRQKLKEKSKEREDQWKKQQEQAEMMERMMADAMKAMSAPKTF